MPFKRQPSKVLDLVEQGLAQRIVLLELENAELRARVDFLERHPTLTAGIAGEILIVDLLNGTATPAQFGSDVRFEHNSLRIEVKLSRLNRASKRTSTMRWSWQKVLGQSGEKVYDRLILLGLADDRFRSHYLDPESPYVIFDVPYDQVLGLSQSSKPYRTIQLTTNPLSAKSSLAARLFSEYQVTRVELQRRYCL